MCVSQDWDERAVRIKMFCYHIIINQNKQQQKTNKHFTFSCPFIGDICIRIMSVNSPEVRRWELHHSLQTGFRICVKKKQKHAALETSSLVTSQREPIALKLSPVYWQYPPSGVDSTIWNRFVVCLFALFLSPSKRMEGLTSALLGSWCLDTNRGLSLMTL